MSLTLGTDVRGRECSIRAICILVLCLLVLLFVNGCSTFKKTGPQSGISGYKEVGLASYYARKFQFRKTASGDVFDNGLMTAAHRTLPFGTEVIVTNLNNGKSITVTINDRGPFIQKRIIDLTRTAFAKIEDIDKGLVKVEIFVN